MTNLYTYIASLQSEGMAMSEVLRTVSTYMDDNVKAPQSMSSLKDAVIRLEDEEFADYDREEC